MDQLEQQVLELRAAEACLLREQREIEEHINRLESEVRDMVGLRIKLELRRKQLERRRTIKPDQDTSQ